MHALVEFFGGPLLFGAVVVGGIILFMLGDHPPYRNWKYWVKSACVFIAFYLLVIVFLRYYITLQNTT